jgi:hypothetical protein
MTPTASEDLLSRLGAVVMKIGELEFILGQLEGIKLGE